MEYLKLIEIIDKYYPSNIDLDDFDVLNESIEFKNLTEVCLQESNKKQSWNNLLNKIKILPNVEIWDHSLLFQSNPSFIAAFVSDEKQQCKLILKISVLAPVYSLYYDNLSENFNKRFIRCNPITVVEELVFNYIKESLEEFYTEYSMLKFSDGFSVVSHTGRVKINSRQPYLDELVFGPYMSIHPM